MEIGILIGFNEFIIKELKLVAVTLPCRLTKVIFITLKIVPVLYSALSQFWVVDVSGRLVSDWVE